MQFFLRVLGAKGNGKRLISTEDRKMAIEFCFGCSRQRTSRTSDRIRAARVLLKYDTGDRTVNRQNRHTGLN
jgi:hypothetical protein